MKTLLMTVRLTVILLWTALLLSIRLSFYPLARANEIRDRRWRRYWVKVWARGVIWLCGGTIEVHGPPPETPFYLVANHLSYMDIFLLMTQTGCGFVARGDMEHWPIVGPAAKSLYILFIDRSSRRDAARVNELIAHALKMEDGITVFPESRISRGIDVEPFKSALVQPAINAGAPVHYATITYRTAEGQLPANHLIGWWRPEPLFYHIKRMLKARGFVAVIRFGENPLHGDDRKVLSEALHQAVRAQFEAVE